VEDAKAPEQETEMEALPNATYVEELDRYFSPRLMLLAGDAWEMVHAIEMVKIQVALHAMALE